LGFELSINSINIFLNFTELHWFKPEI
jgi:hypothetical protein